MSILLFRTLIIYLLLTIAMRIMGKRQLGELQVSELISTLLLSEIAALPISDPNLPLSYALIPVIFIFLMEILIPSLFFRSPKLRRIIEGTPSVLIDKGKIRQDELKRNRITPEEFYAILRTNGIANLSDVSYAILEASGAISIFRYSKNEPPTCDDFKPKIKPTEAGIMHILISDGRVRKDSLDKLNISDDDLMKMLKESDAKLEDVYLFTIDDLGKTDLIRTDKKIGGKKS